MLDRGYGMMEEGRRSNTQNMQAVRAGDSGMARNPTTQAVRTGESGMARNPTVQAQPQSAQPQSAPSQSAPVQGSPTQIVQTNAGPAGQGGQGVPGLDINQLLQVMVEKNASDLHITVGSPPQLMIDGSLYPIKVPPLIPADTQRLCFSILNDAQRQKFEDMHEVDLSFRVGGKIAARMAVESHEDQRCARSEADAPDIDGRVYVQGMRPAGEFAQVRVVGHTDYDLIAQ